jgi:hypothetical protein
MMRKGWCWLLGWLLLIAASPEVRAEARAWLDRETVVLGETVTLNVEVDGVLSSAPELAPLATNFRIGSTSSSAQMSVVNGRTLARTLWAVVLEPREAGVVGVPALAVGNERTSPLSLTVLPAPSGSTARAGDDVFLEVEASPLDPYVQQQVRYTVRLFYAVQLLEGQLDEPQPDGVRLQRLGSDTSFQRIIGGRRYQVVERHYLLAAERSGTVQIPPPRFRGRAIGPGMFGRSAGSILQATGDSIALDVRAAPPAAPRPWLPTPELTLQDESGALPQRVAVGEPLTLSLRVAAQGLFAEQLPEVELPTVDGAQVYPDRESTQTVEHSGGVIGERVRKFAVVPNRAGTLELPAIRIRWWNTQTDAAEVAELPARRIEVMVAAAGAGSPPVLTDAVDAEADAAPAPVPVAADAARAWQLGAVVGLMLLLWFATLAWGLYWRRRARVAGMQAAAAPVAPPSGRAPAPRLTAALVAGDVAAIAAALRGASPLPVGDDLQAVARQLDDATQAAAVLELERALYADGDHAAAIAHLRAAFARGPRWRRVAAGDPAANALPPLYR